MAFDQHIYNTMITRFYFSYSSYWISSFNDTTFVVKSNFKCSTFFICDQNLQLNSIVHLQVINKEPNVIKLQGVQVNIHPWYFAQSQNTHVIKRLKNEIFLLYSCCIERLIEIITYILFHIWRISSISCHNQSTWPFETTSSTS